MNNYNLSKEESIRFRIVKYIAIIFVVYIHTYATTVYFADGVNNNPLLPNWLLLIEDLISQVISRCGVPIFFLFLLVLLFGYDYQNAFIIQRSVKSF